MATMVLHPRSTGILLNPSPKYRLASLPIPADLSSSFSTATTVSSEEEDEATTSYTFSPRGRPTDLPRSPKVRATGSLSRDASRKIRFAPLPDPRRAVLVAEDGQEIPIITLDDEEDEAASNLYSSVANFDSPNEKPQDEWELLQPSPSGADTPPESLSPYPATPTVALSPCETPPSSPFIKKTRSLFRPFMSNVSTEDVLTLGATYLYRAHKPKTHDDTGYDSATDKESFGVPLSRTASVQSTASTKKKKRDKKSVSTGVPFRRTQSYTPETGSALSRIMSNPTKSPRTPTTPSSAGRKQGQRMLNGRVYGQRRNQNLFASARDTEPEFVEWGYGGMGSVKQQTGSAMWAPLQSKESAHSAAADDDDGSGMAWIKRRREERERQKAIEAAAKPNEAQEEQPTTQQEPDTPQPEEPPAPQPEPEIETPKEVFAEEVLEDGAHTTVCLAVPQKPPPVRRGSRDDERVPEHVTVRTEPDVEDKAESNSSSSGDEEEDDYAAEADDDEAEDEETERLRQTKMAMSAGVEKISKHKN